MRNGDVERNRLFLVVRQDPLRNLDYGGASATLPLEVCDLAQRILKEWSGKRQVFCYLAANDFDPGSGIGVFDPSDIERGGLERSTGQINDMRVVKAMKAGYALAHELQRQMEPEKAGPVEIGPDIRLVTKVVKPLSGEWEAFSFREIEKHLGENRMVLYAAAPWEIGRMTDLAIFSLCKELRCDRVEEY